MKDELITYATAKLAAEKGFDWKCVSHFNEAQLQISNSYNADNYHRLLIKDWNSTIGNISCPTQSLLQRWLREVHNCIVESCHYIKSDDFIIEYEYYINYYGKDKDIEIVPTFSLKNRTRKHPLYSTYETALEEGLKQALLLL